MLILGLSSLVTPLKTTSDFEAGREGHGFLQKIGRRNNLPAKDTVFQKQELRPDCNEVSKQKQTRKQGSNRSHERNMFV